MLVNRMPRYEILSEDAVATLDRGWRRIVSELGVEFALPEAAEMFAAAGQKVDGPLVKLDPEFVMEQVAKVPREFDVRARNPEQSCTSAAGHGVRDRVRATVRAGGRRASRCLDGGLRELLPALAGLPGARLGRRHLCEPNDTPLDSRHLDMVYALQTLTDKPYMGSVTSGPNAADTVRMTEILFGGREPLEELAVQSR